MNKTDFNELKKLKNACINNAKNFIEAAEKLTDYPNIQFNLSILAIEEIGKAKINNMAFISKSLGREISNKYDIDDHIKKLFIVFIDLHRINNIMFDWNKIPDVQKITKNIHFKRLKAIYVEPTNLTPFNIISKEEAAEIIDFSRYVIKAEELYELDESDNDDTDLIWFINLEGDEEKRSFIFKKSNFEKLNEFQSIRDWLHWLKNEYDRLQKEYSDLINTEMVVKKIKYDDIEKPKWKIRYRIFTNTHIIKQKNINFFNERNEFYKLYSVKNKNEFIFELYVPKSIHLTNLLQYSLNYTHIFLLSLNIGSLGFFWYCIPDMTKKIQKSVFDIEKNKELYIGFKIIPDLDFFDNEELDSEDVRNQQLVFIYLGDISETPKFSFLSDYLKALNLLSRNNLFLRFEKTIYLHLFKAFKNILISHKEWDGKSSLKDVVIQLFSKKNVNNDNTEMLDEFQKAVDIGLRLESDIINVDEIDLKKVFVLKMCIDMFIIIQAKKNLNQKLDNSE